MPSIRPVGRRSFVAGCGSIGKIELRGVEETDLDVFFEQQLDPLANRMVAFRGADPSNRDVFSDHLHKILGDKENTIRTVIVDGFVSGYVTKFDRSGVPEVGY